MCVTNGYTEVLEWWKETEIVELFCMRLDINKQPHM